MGVLMFKYDTKPVFRHENLFEYFYNNSIINSFSYQRYVALVDMSILKGPVAITKVVPGIFDLEYISKINGVSVRRKDKEDVHVFKEGIISKNKKEMSLLQTETEIKKQATGALSLYPIWVINTKKKANISYEYTSISQEDKEAIKNKIIFGTPQAKILNRIKTLPIATTPFYVQILSGAEKLNAKQKQYILNTYESWFLGKNSNILSMYKNVSLTPRYAKGLNVIEVSNAKLSNQYKTNIIEQLNIAKTKDIIINISFPVSLSISNNYIVNNAKTVNAIKIPKYIKASLASLIMSQKTNILNTNINKCIQGDKLNNCNAFLSESLNLFKDDTVYVDTINALSGKIIRNINVNTTEILSGKNIPVDGFIDYHELQGLKNKKESFIDSYYVIKGLKDRKKSWIDYSNEFLSKNFHYSQIDYVRKMLNKKIHHGQIDYVRKMLNKKFHAGQIANQQLQLNKSGKYIQTNDTPYFFKKTGKELQLDAGVIPFHKNEKVIQCIEKDTFLFKHWHLSRDFILHNLMIFKKEANTNKLKEDFFVDKNARDIALFATDTFLKKDRLPIRTDEENIFIQKLFHSAKIYEHTVTAIKEKLFVSIDYSNEMLAKNFHPLDYIGGREYTEMILPLSKLRQQVYIDRIDEMASKYSKDIFITEGEFSSVIPKNLAMPETNFFFEEKSIKAFVDYKNIFATKLKVKSSIGKDIFAFKIHKESSIYENVFLHKNIKEVWINPNIHTFKKDREITLNIDMQAVKNINQVDINSMVSFLPKLKDVHINIDEWLKKEKPHMNILDMIFAEKPGKTCYYDYGEWVKKEDLSLYLETQEAIIKSKVPMSVIDCCVPAIRELEGFYDYGVFAEKNLECDIFHQMKALEITKHVMLNPESCKNWAWIYEDPDPFQGDAFGIDELLLPERDTRYADFIDIIFDKENMVPRNPISQINDTTFVGKYPTRHPIPEYEDIGIVYLDVRTSIMHDIFLEYYKIWQSKIFEFGAMNMVQSSKLMLEYIYSWIMTTYHNEPDDPKLSEALRVFRQIRWYTERAIIQNAQYIISYEMAPLESKLTTGTCAIPNDLDTNDSMFIDSQKGVIKPNPLYFGTQSAHVSFTIENLKDTSFSFSLSNNTGSVKIYLNGALIDTVYHSGSLIYGIPYTGTENTIKIEKSAADNINAAFYIGYIKVPDMSFKDLKVEFDPTLRAGNRPINEVAQKMIAYANNHDDVQKAYEEIRKANLGVSETYKKMLDYWHLHHQNKTKGKRLTIKEV